MPHLPASENFTSTSCLDKHGEAASIKRSVRGFLLALFAAHDVYYPGDKWIPQTFARFSIDHRALKAWEAIWTSGTSPADQVRAADSQAELAEELLLPAAPMYVSILRRKSGPLGPALD